jgi:hypothetical protein
MNTASLSKITGQQENFASMVYTFILIVKEYNENRRNPKCAIHFRGKKNLFNL